ncbi:CBO0543 family protein [Alkalihalobacterium sp. APHAB7]|uniref:CBO0543 family protein n=1 Tax=Alkalihalobacterium sp. APHAB7 TaxID=3402081 RepID=UPI003AAD8751
MFNTLEKNILKTLVAIVLVITPISIIGKEYRKWLLCFFLNSYANTFVAPTLASKGFLKYPERLFPSIFKSSIIYDYFLCSTITIWYCRTTLKDNWMGALLKVWLFAMPQAILEVFFERNTKLIKYSKGWTGIHSLITIAAAKFTIRSIIKLMDILDSTKKA